MVQDMHQHLQPFRFAAPHFFHLQLERGLLIVVHLFHEVAESNDFTGHPVGDGLGRHGGFFRLSLDGFLDAGPLAGGGRDLSGEFFEVLNLFGNRAERVDFQGLAHRPIIENERQGADHRAERSGGKTSKDFPFGDWVRRFPDDIISEREQQHVADQKKATWEPSNPSCLSWGPVSGKFVASASKRLAFCSTNHPPATNHSPVRTCVIFNPAARGNKARHFRHQLDVIGSQCALKATTAPGDARRLAAEAVGEGFDLIVAAGGDGTVNETLNGLGDAPDGFARARLGVLPLGTVNVFARELKIPLRIERAWEVLQGGRETCIDLPRVEFSANGSRQRQYFVQLAGAGLDARAIELVDWGHKKKIGPLAYLVAGLKALRETKPGIAVRADGREFTGELVLIGNGRFYGGPFGIFPAANLHDGQLEVCVFPRIHWLTLLRCAPGLLARQKLPETIVQRVSAATFELMGEAGAAFEAGRRVGRSSARDIFRRARKVARHRPLRINF